TVHMYDVDLLEIGDGAVVGGDAVVMGHVYQEGSVYYKRVRIAPHAEIGFGTIVLPGVDIGEGAIVGAKSLVPRNAILPPHTIWAGVPVRRIDGTDRKSTQEEEPRVISMKC